MTNDEDTTTSNLTREVSLGIRNGVKLMASLGVTLSVAFAVRFWVPRFLGPEMFGMIHFSEQFSLFLASVIAFGADVYIRKEVAERPSHASEIFGGLLMFRAALSLIVGIVIAFVLYAMGKEYQIWQIVYIYLLGQLIFISNISLGALLEARGTVNELATINAGLKIVWGIGTIGGLLLGYGLIAIPLAFCVSEALKTPMLYQAARKHLDLRLHFNFITMKTIVFASLPYCANFVSLNISNRLGVSILSVMTNDEEVGWFGAADNLNNIIFLFIPIVTSILLPMGARLAKESTEDHIKTIVTSVRILLMFSIPAGAIIALNAKDVIHILYADNYAPTAVILQIMAPLVPLTFLCTIASLYLIQVGQIWQLVKIQCIAMVLISPALKYLFIKVAEKYPGNGAGGIALAASDVIVEILMAILLYLNIRVHVSSVNNNRIGGLIARILIICGIVGAIHPFVSVLGYWRIALDVSVYAILASSLGALPVHEFRMAAKNLLRSKRE